MKCRAFLTLKNTKKKEAAAVVISTVKGLLFLLNCLGPVVQS